MIGPRTAQRTTASTGRSSPRFAILAVLAAGMSALGGCVADRPDVPPVAIVRDLSSVAGCRFVGTVGAPPIRMGLRSAAGYDSYIDALRRETYAHGGSHLYLLNEAAGWGAARAVGTAYACIDPLR